MSNMQPWKQNVASIIDFAEKIFPDVEVVTRELSGKISTTNYKNISLRAKNLALHLKSLGLRKSSA